jgi:hypothetical protein
MGVAFRVAVGVLVLAAFAWLSGSANKIQTHCDSNEGANNKYCSVYKLIVLRARETSEFLDEHDGAVTALSTTFIAIFTIVLAIIARGQFRATRIVERAYIGVWPRGIEPSHVDRADRVHALVVFRNTGHLPARNVSWNIQMGSWEGNDTEPPEVTVDPMKNVLAPGGEIFTSSDIMFSNKTPNNTFIWGKITYDDGFGVPRFTKFCHYYRTKGYVVSDTCYEIPASDARTWPKGNDAS